MVNRIAWILLLVVAGLLVGCDNAGTQEEVIDEAKIQREAGKGGGGGGMTPKGATE